MKIQNVKGGYDYTPKEQVLRNYITNTLKEVFETFGYKSIETPILCYYDILSDKYSAESDILKEIYRFKDQGNRDLGLRYDLTVPFAKFIALNKNKITLPFKRYEINKVFRDGPVKVGRDREFTQCDVDVVGLTGANIEIELLSLYVLAFSRLDIDIIIRYNNRSLMNGLILESGIAENLLSEITTLLDKKDKLSKEEFRENILLYGISEDSIEALDKYFAMSLSELQERFINTPNKYLEQGLKEISELNALITELGYQDKTEFVSSLARGQNYYTGNVFEVYDKEGVINSSIGGGGRYDNMITNFIADGEAYPAVGISFGLSVIYEILRKRENLFSTSETKLFIIPLNTFTASLNLANKLRELGINTEVEMSSRKLKKSLDYANKEKIPYVIILGEDELMNESITVKEMFNRTEIKVALTDYEKIKELMEQIS